MAAALLCAGAARAAPADMCVYLPGGDAPKAEALAGDERYAVRVVTGKFAWPPADCAGVCVTFEAFEKSARRTGTLMRVYAKGGSFRRDREVDFLPQISADAVKDHLDSLTIIVHSILHEVTIPSAEVALTPSRHAPAERPVAAQPPPADVKPAAVVEKDEDVSPVARERAKAKKARELASPPPPPLSFPMALTVGADWVNSALMAPGLGVDAGARLGSGFAASLGYRYRFAASFAVGDGAVSAVGQRYAFSAGWYLPRYKKLDFGVFVTPVIEALEVTSDLGTVRHANLLLMGGELRMLYRAQPEVGAMLSIGAQYATNTIRMEFQGGAGSWETGNVSVGVVGGLFYDLVSGNR